MSILGRDRSTINPSTVLMHRNALMHLPYFRAVPQWADVLHHLLTRAAQPRFLSPAPKEVGTQTFRQVREKIFEILKRQAFSDERSAFSFWKSAVSVRFSSVSPEPPFRRSASSRRFPAAIKRMAEYRHSAHVVHDLKYHLIWCTKYRYKILHGRVAERARDLIRQVCHSREVTIIRGAISRTTYTCWWRR